LFARLRAGASLEYSQAELNTIEAGLKAADPDHNDLRVVPLREHFTGAVKTPLTILFSAAGAQQPET
jgi:hypothetical protein